MDSRFRWVVPAVLALAAVPAAAKAKAKAQLVLQVTPAGAELFVDDHAMGKASAGRSVDVTPGFHVIRLVYKGDEREERIKFEPGKKTTYSVQFDEGNKPAATGDDLDAPASPDSP